MKACIIQPPYSRDLALSDEYFEYKINLLEQCDSSIDIIVLPEYSDVPCATTGRDDSLEYHKKYIDRLLSKCIETAKRCNSLLFVNALSLEETGYRNTTYCYNRKGELVGKYFKKHLPPLEVGPLALDAEYTYDFSEPYVLEIEGLRFGFLTCYDFYFYEAFGNIARQNLDIIIGNSLQRSDSHDAIEIMCRFLAYNTNTHVIRSSVSFDESSDICGASMVVTPKGKVLCNMRGRFGMDTAEFDPKDKYYKPAGYGNPDAPHYSYIEYGRKPWQYRPGGSFIARHDAIMQYPRICAHRGFSSVAPENSLPAFGAAIALGAQEIEFDLWLSKDEEWVSIHDYKLDRVSDGSGNVWDYTLEELKQFDFGKKYAPEFEGLRILTFEEILKKLSCHTVMNIHIKTLSEAHISDNIYTDVQIKKMLDLLDKYDCRKYVYFMTTDTNLQKRLGELAPDIPRCMGEDFDKDKNIVDQAIELGCKKVQLFKPHFTKEMIDKAHAHGIICNVFWSDDVNEAKEFLDMGIDTILTNDYQRVSQIIK
ncbi:MAG: hypothetical protein IJN96_00480 [Clostridia bacterium]|nr:hypothetical protein [Clostridia bacterium]